MVVFTKILEHPISSSENREKRVILFQDLGYLVKKWSFSRSKIGFKLAMEISTGNLELAISRVDLGS